MSESCHITLFGSLRVHRGEQVITRFRYQKAGGLLAYLAHHLKQAHPREVLIDLFWPESSPEAGRASLSTALSSLRNQLEPPGTPSNALLRADRFSVSLNPATVTTDVGEFEAAIQQASRTGNSTERLQNLTRAMELYQGKLLPGFYEEWITPEQERLAGRFFDAASTLIALLQEQGDLPNALRYGRQAVSLDPLREEAQERLMHLLVAVGQPGAALRQYRALERLMEEEFGEEPSAHLRALVRQIEKQSGLSAPPLPAPTVAPPPPMGSVPTGVSSGVPTTANLLLTDIQGFGQGAERMGEAFQEALNTHHRVLRQVMTQHNGQEVRETGASFVLLFPSPHSALTCAIAFQQAIQEVDWTKDIGQATVRVALHTGDIEYSEGAYHGDALNRGSRLLTAAHGGQILVSEPTAGLLQGGLKEGVRLADLGVWRLRNAPAPERLYQAQYPGMPMDGFGPPVSEAGYQSHLPLRLTRFFGRAEEIARITDLLRSRENRLLTLTGAGGTGKTRLALEAADLLLERFAGAVWFVPLADLSESGLIASAIREAMRLPSSPVEPLEQVVEALNRQPSLLVLDNFEHFLRGECEREKNGTAIVQTLLERVPGLTLLVTSRQALGLSAEREFPIFPLPTPNGPDTPEQLSLYDSVRLFVDRAQAVKPDFQVSSHNAPAVAELCDRLEGIPLAIELAAARAQVMTPAQMLMQLQNRFDFLASRKRDANERHRTLRAAVEWSYRLLSSELQRFFTRLSVFRGGWTAEAAEAVCEEPLALDYLALLQEGSLVLSDETEQAMRFRMLETLREYAHEQLTEEENITLHRRHIQFFRWFVMEEKYRTEPLRMAEPTAVWLDRVEREYDNLRAALDWCVTEQKNTDEGWQLAGPLRWFWAERGRLREGRAYLDRSVVWAEEAEPSMARAGVSNSAGILADILHDFAAAHAHFEQCVEMIRTLGEVGALASALSNLGIAIGHEGDSERERAILEESLAFARTLQGKERGIAAKPLYYLGNNAIARKDYVQARAWLEEGLTLLQESGNSTQGIYDSLGTLALAQGDYVEARRCWQINLAQCQEGGLWLAMVGMIGRFSQLALVQGQPIKAARLRAAEKVMLEKIGATTPNLDYGEWDRDMDASRTALGEEAFAVAWAEGSVMTMEQAVAYALEEHAD